ncbi:MAG: hypothetical protein K1X55_03905 [Chitinophagales bacterium]|nr:hypothetical protein [Chitinophagales bacterium]
MKRYKIFHIVAIIGIILAFIGHTIGHIISFTQPPKPEEQQLFDMLSKTMVQTSPVAVNMEDILDCFSWTFSLFALFWACINIFFFRLSFQQKKGFLLLNMVFALINMVIEIKYAFLPPQICFGISTIGFVGAWLFFKED